MNTFELNLRKIERACSEHAFLARKHIETLTMPHWALGRVLDLSVELSAMCRKRPPPVRRKTVFVMAADHGVAAEGVSLYPKEVTGQMVRNFVSGGAAINVLCRQMGARTVIVDAGVDADLTALVRSGQVVDGKVRRGTRNFAQEPAMTREEAFQALRLGFDLALDYSPTTDVYATGDMGIANTTSSAAIAAVLTKQPVDTIVGRGTGIDDDRLAHKTRVIESAIQKHQPNADDAVDVLAKLGGYEIGAIAGLILGAAFEKKPVLVDGYISTAGALIAARLCPASRDYMIASHASAEHGHMTMWGALEKRPLLDLGLRLGEGTGAALAMPLLDAASLLLAEMATFADAQVSERKRDSELR